MASQGPGVKDVAVKAQPDDFLRQFRQGGIAESNGLQLLQMALQHLWMQEDHLEQLEAIGFGDPALAELAKEIIRLRLDGDVLDSGALARHLATKGLGGLLSEVDLAAKRAALTFLDPNVPLKAAKSLWANAFDVLTRLAAIEDAIASAKARLETRRDMEAIASLKAERDALRRSIGWGTDWTDRPARDG